MLRYLGWLVVLSVWVAAGPVHGDAGTVPVAIVGAKDASFAEKLAAKEVRRYVYLRTGKLLPIVSDLKAAGEGGLIVVGSKGQALIKDLLAASNQGATFLVEGKLLLNELVDADFRETVAGLSPDQYLIKTIQPGNRRVILVAGGDDVGTLYGAYRLAERLGVRFYMHGDVVPDKRIPLSIPAIAETGKPLFDRRGIQPFHDFPEGPDWWNADDYKAILGQLAKMRMNFFGLHTYPQSSVGPEPLTWIGTAGDIAPGGKVKFSYPSRHFVTLNVTGAWGYQPMKTGDYTYGADAIFPRDDFGADYMQGTHPWNKMSPAASNALFDRMGEVLKESFTFARRLGIKTCIGTETPLVIPKEVQERLKKAGKDPTREAVVQEVYEGMFQRIVQTHPLDYYWLWTPEGWTWNKVEEAHIKDTLSDFRAVTAAAAKVKAPFTLATCGWVLGPPQDPALFDNTLPKTMPMSCISRQVGNEPVEPGFAKVKGRPKWSIPWMEDDPGMILPQLWAGRMRKDAADSLAHGCTGLMGIHWRTRVLGPNVSALAKAAWGEGITLKPTSDPPARPAEGPVGGQGIRSENTVSAAEDAPLYQTARYNMKSYRFHVPDGPYTVTLKFSETRYTEKGKRVFGVKIQGKTVIERLDIFEKVGPNKALDLKFEDQHAMGDQLLVEFVPQVGAPSICAIVVHGTGALRKINCGGPKYNDFAADLPASAPGGTPRYLPVDDFYLDYATAEFGPEAAAEIGKIFARIDCHLPRPADWVTGPGNMKPDSRPWSEAGAAYAFVDELAALQPRVVGQGNRDRFDYWLDTFRYLRAMGQADCTWARYNAAMNQVKAAKTPEARKKLAQEVALPIRKELVAQVGELHRHLLATVSTPGEMGTVTNIQSHSLPDVLVKPGEELAKILGEPLPADAMPGRTYQGQLRLTVPTVRTALVAGETLTVPVVLQGPQAREVALYWRPLGSGEFAKVPAVHVARGTYRAALPAGAVAADLEYYIEAALEGGPTLHWPRTAPELNQSVVVVKE